MAVPQEVISFAVPKQALAPPPPPLAARAEAY
jgi:hypothetical protein